MPARRVDSCLACDISAGKYPLPGGLIHKSEFWLVEHCVGPLVLGTLIVRPERHVTSVADLTQAESVELGPLLRRASQIVRELVQPEHIYNCLWSHAGGVPVHIHYVVQPITADEMDGFGVYGPALQLAMFDKGDKPATFEIERFAEAARRLFEAPEIEKLSL